VSTHQVLSARRSLKERLSSLARQPQHEDRHYFSIDLLRGFAAIAVVFCHYQYFYSKGAETASELGNASRQPLYAVFWPLYAHGQYAVMLFWVISGFVFSVVYVGKRPGARSFFVHRFSRLYPLHFATLIAIALVQGCSFRALGHFQIYAYNDLRHFILNLLFISGWGFQRGVAFNFPIWSVSAEIVIYWVFFLSLPVLFRNGLMGPLVFAVSFFAINAAHPPTPVPRCGLYFFLGCCVFVILKSWRAAAPALCTASIGLTGILFALDRKFFLGEHYLLLFPAVVLILGYIDETFNLGAVKSRLAWIGESTYSIYLLGLPLQATLMLILETAGIDRPRLADHVWFLVAYVALLLVLARLSYLHLELPLRTLLRKRMLPDPVGVPAFVRRSSG